MSGEELEQWLDEIEPESPLHESLLADLEAHPLPVDEAAVNRVVARLSVGRPASRRPLWIGLALAAIALAGVGLTRGALPSVEVVEVGEPIAITSVPPEPVAAAPAVPLVDHRAAIAARIEVGDAFGAWQLFLVCRQQYGADAEGLEADLRRIAVMLHQASMQTEPDDLDALAQAGEAYAMYLVDYPNSAHDADMRYAWAEMLYKAERHDEAYAQYLQVVHRHPESPRAKFCAESAIFAADQMIAKGADWDAQALVAADTWLERWPDDPKATTIRYKAAYLLQTSGDLAAAEGRFLEILRTDPDSAEAGFAANLVVDGYVVERDWRGLADVLVEGSAQWPQALGDQTELIEALIEQLGDTDPQRVAALTALLTP